MSNNSSPTLLHINEITTNIYRFTFPPLIIFGLIGHILDIIIFTRPKLISNSCCNYFLTSSCVSIIQILFGQLFRLLKGGYHIPITVLWWCRVLARRLIPIVLISSGFCRSHMLAFFVIDKNEEDECWAPKDTNYRLSFDIVFLIVHGIIFPVLMGIFGFLTVYNIRRGRRYDQQHGVSSLRRHRIQGFQRMTLVQTTCIIALTLPFAVHKLHRTITHSHLKTPEKLAWERLSMSIVRLLWFFHDSGAFYIYSLSSVKFRHELFKFLDEHLPRRVYRMQRGKKSFEIRIENNNNNNL
ncbi:unnamed protein product [Rotaria sp. Silwood2]|nr:unnamed protein product [Rotaria sp. Silwood2]